MALPKGKISKARKRKRRAHLSLLPEGASICPHCKQGKQPHRICGNCGYYGNRPIVVLQDED